MLFVAFLFVFLFAARAAAQPQAGGAGPRAEQSGQRFVVLGDYGTTDLETFAVAARMRALDPWFLITLGDNNYPSGAAATLDQNVGQHYHDFIAPYTGNYGTGAVTNRFFPCLGNHDWLAAGAQPYLDYFELPGNERYYDFRRGPLHFFALDSDPSEPDGTRLDSVQAQWLEQRMRHSSAPFKIVYMHHAPYDSCDNHGSQGDLQWPFKEWGASIVLAGHDHVYERTHVSGLPYLVNGLGGRDNYGFNPPIGGSQVRFNAGNGALLVEADPDFAHFRFVTSVDSIQDDYWLPRGGIDPGTVALIAEDASWSYLDTGIDPGPSWKGRAFDDSSWAVGRAQLGYGDGDETTVVAGGPAGNHHITTWFRHAFALTHPEEFESLQLRLLHDDGAVVYLNGQEVARSRMPAGIVTAATQATVAVGGNEERTFYPFLIDLGGPFDPRIRPAKAGRNVLAVEIHQSSASSSDISFAAELVGLRHGRVLLPRRSPWRYLDTGAAPGVGWRKPAFDDSGWSLGEAQLGYGEGDERTLVNESGPTTWYRARFEVSDLASIRWLACRLLRDDGAIVYLNGREAARINLPRTDVTPATLAAFDVGPAFEGLFEESPLDPRLLVEGTNTIAVEVHQASAAPEDLSFDLELVAHE